MQGNAARPRWTDYLIVLAAALLLYAPVLLFGMPYGHDGATYAAWLEAFSQEIGDGVLYPRWLASMGQGAGSPAFFFYPPLAYYVMAGMALLAAPGTDVFLRMGAGLFPFFAISGLGFYWAVRPSLGKAGALSGAIVYLLLPYHYGVDLWFRGDAAEFAGYGFAPLCLGFLLRLDQNWRAAAGLAVSFALMVLTHLPTALILALGLGVVALWRGWDLRNPLTLVRFAVAIITGLALCGLYLVPALTMQDITSMHRMWADRFAYSANFLVTSSDPNMLPILKALALASAAILLPAAALLNSTRRRLLLLLAGATAGIWFAMLPASGLFWEMLAPLQKVQFPWRFGILLDLALAALAGAAVKAALRRRDRLGLYACAAGGAGLVLANLPFLIAGPATQMPFMEAAAARLVREAIATRRDTAEYRPPTARKSAPPGPAVSVAAGSARVQVVHWRSREIALQVEARQPSIILIRHYHAPLWEAVADEGPRLPLGAAPESGLMQLSVSAGDYRVMLRLRFAPAERWGAVASMAGLIGLGLLSAMPALAGFARRRLAVEQPPNLPGLRA